MKKMNILFILITLIMIFGTNNVLADTIDMDYLSSHSTGNRQYNFSSYGGQQVDYTINFDTSNMQVKDYSYIQGNLYVINKTQSKTNASTQNINWVETCTSHTDNGTTYGNNGRIVYADGTIAQIDYSQRTFYCNQWNTTGTVSNNDIQFNFDNSPSIQLMVRTNQNNELPCELNDTIFKCPIGQYEQLNYIKVRVLPKGVQSDYWVSFSNVIYKFKDSSSIIINNQNNINNSIQDTKDTITSSTIDSTTNTDNLITIPNSNGKNTILDLLMVPINFITSIVNSFSNSCVSYNLGNLLGTDLILPCINLQNILGSGLYNIIDAIFAFGMIFAFIRSVKKFIQKALLLASDVSSEVSIF